MYESRREELARSAMYCHNMKDVYLEVLNKVTKEKCKPVELESWLNEKWKKWHLNQEEYELQLDKLPKRREK